MAAVKGLVHESQSLETVNDCAEADVNVLVMEDMRVKARLTQKSARIASWIQMRKGIFEITRTQQYTDSQLVPMQIGVHPKSNGKGARNETFEKVKYDDLRKCYHCTKTGHAKSQCKT